MALSSAVFERVHGLSSLEEHAAFFDFLRALRSAVEPISGLIRSPESKANVIQGLRGAAKSGRPWLVKSAANSYQAKLADFAMDGIPVGGVLDVSGEIDTFLANFEDYLVSQSDVQLVKMAWQAGDLSCQLDGFVTALREVTSMLQPPGQDQGDVLRILVPGVLDIQQTKQALVAIQRMYEGLARFVGVSPESDPLELLKIESGSLELILRGSKAVVQVLGKFIAGFSAYAFLSKRVSDTSLMASSLQAQLDLANALKDQGMDVGRTSEELAAAAEVLARHTLRLIANADQIGVNGTVVGLTNDLVKLTASSDKMLPPPSSGSEE